MAGRLLCRNVGGHPQAIRVVLGRGELAGFGRQARRQLELPRAAISLAAQRPDVVDIADSKSGPEGTGCMRMKQFLAALGVAVNALDTTGAPLGRVPR